MFEEVRGAGSSPAAALLGEIAAAARAENQGAALQLAKIGEFFALRHTQGAADEEWVVDTMEAVAAEVAAALRISQGMAASRLRYARALRERLPLVGEVFKAGDIDYRAFTTIVYRTDLIEDREVLAGVDRQLAATVGRWPSMTQGRLGARVDKIVAQADRDAVRRRKERQRDREVWFGPTCEGAAEFGGSLLAPDAHALDARLNALAATVCPHDPRTREQRRADALGALAAGGDRLGCRCARPDCAAGGRRPASPVVIHVLAEQATVAGRGDAPASELSADGLITPELLAELAASAKLVPLVHPALDAAPEQGYTPSKALSDFVRCRDLTCRAPGCDRPAVHCDLDHTIPYAQGGATHASNVKCLCRLHHLLKTFCGWQDEQLPDGTVIWRLPDGQTYVTTPGSALLFPYLCAPTGPAPRRPVPADEPCTDRAAMMPTRRRTRAQDRATRIATERRHNRDARMARNTAAPGDIGPAPPDDDPPPF
ncbi:HNH endonuclease signature motif containing protein [Mycobacterium sp. Marseille-P9652]|uniref:HNH endonuclease signature motif containing protein n=1 Tax=Mycobacterium sp. Marseille-P9652 TaxID=2654950 RepID=UPI0012E72BD3|nr:HNH endonuclease signature motif containing protein [Mycobacterium sp. Marseille-P9652]